MLTREEFEKLKSECKKYSDTDITMVPGFTIDDEVGNHYFFCGSDFSYPDKVFLTADGKRFVSDDPELGRNGNRKLKGQLSMTTLNYAYTLNSFKFTRGNYLFSKDAAPFANFFANWDAMGVITTENNKLLEDSTKGFLELVDYGQGPLPMAITLMNSPDAIKNNKWRTVLKFSRKKNETLVSGIKVNFKTKILDYFNTQHFYPDNPAKIYITNGPEIVYWGYCGPRDYEGNNKGNFVFQNYRWKLRGIVRSDNGIKEVSVFDGTELFRKFRPDGKKIFKFELELTHDKQHNLVLIVTDINGNKAISGEQWDRNHRLEEFNCSDRNNQLTYGKIIRKDDTFIQLGGNQSLASPYKRIDEKSISPSGTFKNDKILGAPAFDGAAGGEPQVRALLYMRTKGKDLPPPQVSESFRLFASGDVNIGEGKWDYYFRDNIRVANVWHTLWSVKPADIFTVTKRNYFFTPDPDSPLAVFLWEIKIQLKKDYPNRGFSILGLNPAKSKLWTIRSDNGTMYSGIYPDTPDSHPRNIYLPFGKGSYRAALNSPLGGAAIYPLTDGMRIYTGLPRRQRMSLILPANKSPQKAGETVAVKVLLVGIPRSTAYTKNLPASTTETVEKFANDFGLINGHARYNVKLQTGAVISKLYPLDIDGKQKNCFSGIIAGRLISSLPVRVSGLNNNWSAFLYDRKIKRARPVGVFENKAYATVVINSAKNIFIGHPVYSDNKKLLIQVTQSGKNRWSVEVHNPTGNLISANIFVNPYFDPMKKIKEKINKITLKPYSSLYLRY